MTKEAEQLVSNRHLRDRSSRMVLSILLQLRLDFHNPSARFLRINFSGVLATLDFVKEVLIEGFHCSLQGPQRLHEATLPGATV